MKITVDNKNCTAEIEGLNLGTFLSVHGRDQNGNPSGYVYLDGKQICSGFELQGSTMLYDPCEPFSEFIRRHTKGSGRKYRVVVKNDR